MNSRPTDRLTGRQGSAERRGSLRRDHRRPEPCRTDRKLTDRRRKDRKDGARPRELPIAWTMEAVVAAAGAGLAGFLLYRIVSRYSLDQIIAAVMAIPLSRLIRAGGFAAASYLCLTVFDWLGLRYAGHPLVYRKAALASFTSLSLGHNIGFAALSSGAIRYRFYSRWGLDAEGVAKVVVFCGATVGLGLMILGGIALLSSSQLAHEVTGFGRPAIIGLGSALFGPLGGLRGACGLGAPPAQDQGLDLGDAAAPAGGGTGRHRPDQLRSRGGLPAPEPSQWSWMSATSAWPQPM